MKKGLYIIIGIFLIVGIAIAVSVYFLYKNPGPQEQNTTLSDFTDSKIAGDSIDTEYITIPAVGGGLKVKNIFRDAKFTSDDRYLNYELFEGITYTSGAGSDGFVIRVIGDELDLKTSEQILIEALGISELDACKLLVKEYIISKSGLPDIYNESFTFCGKSFKSDSDSQINIR